MIWANPAVDPGDDPAAPGTVADGDADADAARIVDALGVSFATFQLFQSPESQPALERAVATLAHATRISPMEVAGDHFLIARERVHAAHPGVERLAARLFAHGVAAVRFLGPVSLEDLWALFDVICRTPDDALLGGGVSHALERRGAAAIRLVDRAPLVEAPQDDPEESARIWGDRPDSVPHAYSSRAEALAHQLLAEADGDAEAVIALVGEAYSRSLATIDPDDFDAREELVHAFVDAFFYLPKALQGPLLAEFLVRRDEMGFQMLLDQFAHHELQELAPYLDHESHPLLVEYARMSMDEEPPLEDLQVLLDETAPHREPMVPITARIARVVGATGSGVAPARQALHRLQEQLRAANPGLSPAAGVMAGLLTLGPESGHRSRLLRIWARTLVGTIQAGSYPAVVEWASVVLDNPSLDVDAAEIGGVLARTVDLEAIRSLLGLLPDAPEFAPAIERLSTFVPHAVIEALGEERDSRRRRVLLRMLALAGRSDPAPIIAALDDSRWYLVRNLVLVLGRSAQRSAAKPVADLASHPDPRVRREVIRAVHALQDADDPGLFLDAMLDLDQTVRDAAATVLRLDEHPAVLEALIGMLDTDAPGDVKADVVALLASFDSDRAARTIEELASRRVFASSTARAVRSAARQALDGRS